MEKKRRATPGIPSQFSESREDHRLIIVMTKSQREAVRKVVDAENAKHTGARLSASSWGLNVVLEALRKEGYKDW